MPEKTFTFDSVLEGMAVTHAFVIENHGTAPLKVLKVRTSCGCTTAQRPNAIAPGSSGELVVNGNTGGYGGTHFNKSITVYTNDPVAPQIRLWIKGPVAEFAHIVPLKIVLRGTPDDAIQAQATITPNPDHPFRILEIVPDVRIADNIDVRMERQGADYRIAINNRMTTPGQYRGRVMIRTDSALRPQLTIYVIGQINAKKA
ncbi:DUF1573 domain-containing protein [Desulfosarcina ovata]|uniref:DUF1573 domain-containing protein n=1 Tax=Desulfosarcina ovata subsp. ovata TaxID=2752305 RepID=A0A5K8AC24_9BACT|nr:DUF1573 domain-containing protein [Desulfosarcina ovata]BBO89574.1 hypothetical protein DSCOOX_27540 [Desulfosarcina ovata subsp. ovata]